MFSSSFKLLFTIMLEAGLVILKFELKSMYWIHLEVNPFFWKFQIELFYLSLFQIELKRKESFSAFSQLSFRSMCLNWKGNIWIHDFIFGGQLPPFLYLLWCVFGWNFCKSRDLNLNLVENLQVSESIVWWGKV